MLVDSHCHLDGKAFSADREEVIERARGAGVEILVAIGSGDGPPDLEAGIRLAEAYPFVYATVGVHPHEAAKGGEETWVRQLEIAREAGLPVVIHTREAWEETFEILESHWPVDGAGGIMHCFSGGVEQALRSVEMGFHISFSGIVTYPKALEVQEAARVVPRDRLLVETDAPYLAPVPHRGKRNEPAFAVETAKMLAELRGETLEEIAKATSRNWKALCLPEAKRNR